MDTCIAHRGGEANLTGGCIRISKPCQHGQSLQEGSKEVSVDGIFDTTRVL